MWAIVRLNLYLNLNDQAVSRSLSTAVHGAGAHRATFLFVLWIYHTDSGRRLHRLEPRLLRKFDPHMAVHTDGRSSTCLFGRLSETHSSTAPRHAPRRAPRLRPHGASRSGGAYGAQFAARIATRADLRRCRDARMLTLPIGRATAIWWGPPSST